MSNQKKGIYNPLLNKHSSEKEQYFSGMTMWFESVIGYDGNLFIAFKDKGCTKMITIGYISKVYIKFEN